MYSLSASLHQVNQSQEPPKFAETLSQKGRKNLGGTQFYISHDPSLNLPL